MEQIKGALALGMLEIARQTVEFLYEENGGIPRDLKVRIADQKNNFLLCIFFDHFDHHYNPHILIAP